MKKATPKCRKFALLMYVARANAAQTKKSKQTKRHRNQTLQKQLENKKKTFQRIRKCGMRFSHLCFFFWFSTGFCFVVIPCLLVVLVFFVSSGLPTSQHCCSAHPSTHALKAIRHVCAGIPTRRDQFFLLFLVCPMVLHAF